MPSSTLANDKIKIGVIEYPPHLDFNNLENSKLNIYLNNMLKEHKASFEIVRLPQKRAMFWLEKGKIDFLLPYDDAEMKYKVLPKPLFHAVPGLCFKKENFIPILSATHRLKDLVIGIPPKSKVVSALLNSNALIVNLEGEDAIHRGIDLTQRGRIDAFYHPSPIKVYQQDNKAFKEVACSYFHGYFTKVYVAVSAHTLTADREKFEQIYNKAMENMSYEYFVTK